MRVADALASAGLDAREARLLLAQASGFSQATIVAYPERELPREVLERFVDLAARRRAGEPVAYLVGRREFHGLDIAVNPAVLIPRHETELLVDWAIELRPARVLDLGAGSGAVALAIRRALPGVHVVAVEASAAALVVARRNGVKLGLEVDWRHGEWFAPVAGERFDLVVSNPPYVAEGDPHLCCGDLRFEPRSALAAGPDGLDELREIVRDAPEHLAPGGRLLLEHGLGQDGPVRELLARAGLTGIETRLDLAGIARATGGTINS